jgi:hypothetical protein
VRFPEIPSREGNLIHRIDGGGGCVGLGYPLGLDKMLILVTFGTSNLPSFLFASSLLSFVLIVYCSGFFDFGRGAHQCCRLKNWMYANVLLTGEHLARTSRNQKDYYSPQSTRRTQRNIFREKRMRIDMNLKEIRGIPGKIRGTFPRIRGTLPRIRGTSPRIRGTLPQIRGTFPRIRGTLPRIWGTPPQIRGTLPRIWGTPPRIRGTFPLFFGLLDLF